MKKCVCIENVDMDHWRTFKRFESYEYCVENDYYFTVIMNNEKHTVTYNFFKKYFKDIKEFREQKLKRILK